MDICRPVADDYRSLVQSAHEPPTSQLRVIGSQKSNQTSVLAALFGVQLSALTFKAPRARKGLQQARRRENLSQSSTHMLMTFIAHRKDIWAHFEFFGATWEHDTGCLLNVLRQQR